MTNLMPADKTPESLAAAATTVRAEEHQRELALAETKFQLAALIKSARGLFPDKAKFAAWLSTLNLDDSAAAAYLRLYKKSDVLRERMADALAGQLFLIDIPRAEPAPKPESAIDQAAALGEVDGIDLERVASTAALLEQCFKEQQAQYRADSRTLNSIASRAVDGDALTEDDQHSFNEIRARLAAGK